MNVYVHTVHQDKALVILPHQRQESEREILQQDRAEVIKAFQTPLSFASLILFK